MQVQQKAVKILIFSDLAILRQLSEIRGHSMHKGFNSVIPKNKNLENSKTQKQPQRIDLQNIETVHKAQYKRN